MSVSRALFRAFGALADVRSARARETNLIANEPTNGWYLCTRFFDGVGRRRLGVGHECVVSSGVDASAERRLSDSRLQMNFNQ